MTNNQEKTEEAKQRASDLYKKKQFVCSEAIVFTINEILGHPLPAEIVKLASGFAGGIGKKGHACDALTGGVMALGLAFGRTEAGVDCPKILPATREFLRWFEHRFLSSSCKVLIKKKGIWVGKSEDECSVMTGESAAKTMELILKYEKMSSSGILLQRARQLLGTS
jgi:C_GCAxxG_C_C family probable redox protein